MEVYEDRDGIPEDSPEDLGEALAVPVSKTRAERFYDRLRTRLTAYLSKNRESAVAEFLFLVPDVFILLFRLASDKRVDGKNKMLLASGIAYYLFPLDVVPEALLGPVGFLDDLVLSVYVLNKVLQETSPDILREHWSGRGDVLDMIRNVLDSADRLVASDVLSKIKKFVK